MQCIICNSELHQVPAGVSRKTGKAYDSFMGCPNNCKKGSQQTTNLKEPVKDVDWDKIAVGKVRSNLAKIAFEQKLPLSKETCDRIDAWTEYSMTGKVNISEPF